MKVFLAHSKGDIAWAESLKAQCKERGIDLYMYEDDPQYGQLLDVKIRKAIDECMLMVVMFTRKNRGSGYIQQEIAFALEKNKLVIPLIQKGVPESALGYLNGREFLVYDPTNPQLALGKLVEFLEKRQAEKEAEIAQAAQAAQNDALAAKIAKANQEAVMAAIGLALIVVGLILLTKES